MAFDEQAAIDEFWAARARGDYFPAKWFDRLTLDEAYRIQLGVIARRIAAGERQIGWKVGLTAEPIQQQFGFHEPVFGCILDSRQSGHVFRRDQLIRPGFESELCLRVGSDAERRGGHGRRARCDRCGVSGAGDHRDARRLHGADRARDGGQRAAEDGRAG